MNSSPFPDALPERATLQNGNFIIERVLGQGGAGITYLATDTGLQRAAAIKEYFPSGSLRSAMEVRPGSGLALAEFEASRHSFIEEARTLARFNHPGIVDVFTVFIENNTAYMVMEYLHGMSLAQIIEREGPLSQERAARIIEQVGAALEVVHRQAMLHRDIKPDNVMVKEDGTAVLIDFGLTQKLQTAQEQSTRRLSGSSRFGTAGYAPLEQYSLHAQTGVYTDVYALAATLYHLVTGEPPPEAPERAAGLDLPDPRRLNPRLTPAFANAIAQGLAMDARRRPQSVRAFLDLLNASPSPRTRPSTTQDAPARSGDDAPIRVTIPDYSAQPPRHSPPHRFPPQPPEPRPQLDPVPRYPHAPAPVVMPGAGCVRGPSCGCSCLIFTLFILLQLLGSAFFVMDF